jgi:hypothetical protein
MPDWWEGAVALLALAVSAVSAVYARAAHRLEKQREAKENRPPVKARFTKWLSEPSSAEFKLENRADAP